MKNKIEDLRNHLFATLEDLRDPDKPMDLERAKTIANVASVIVQSAKVEVDLIKATGADGTAFFPQTESTPLSGAPGRPRLIKGR